MPVPTEQQLKDYTAQVYRNCPYSDKLLTASPHPTKTAIPTKVGDPSPIKYVIYIIMENRTYDQVFGDVKKGNGDPALVMFGEQVTPNRHKLANEFVLLDNLYCNGHVSRDGHPWSTMAYNTDYIARDWSLTYSQAEGRSPTTTVNGWSTPRPATSGTRPPGPASATATTAKAADGSAAGDGLARMEAGDPGLVGHICPDYGVKVRNGARSATPTGSRSS